jgi:hypothetical protein
MNGFDRNMPANIAKYESHVYTDIAAKQRITSE